MKSRTATEWMAFLNQKAPAPEPPPRLTEEAFRAKQEEMLEDIPIELRGALAGLAWQSGHSAGYEEVINHLGDLVDALVEPCKQLVQRVQSDLRSKQELAELDRRYGY